MGRSVVGKRLAQLALLTLATGEISAAAAELLVLRSDGPRASRHYTVGSRHPDNAVFDLRPGDLLVVLASGGTRQWRGPGYYSLTARPLVLASGARVRVQTGVVRSAPPAEGVQPTRYWDYDVRSAGHLCVAAGARPSLWRPRSATPVRATITAADGTTHSFEWPADRTSMAWPEAMPVRDGARYFLTTGVAPDAVRITAHVVSKAEEGRLDQVATAMVKSGCQGQLQTLIATQADAAAPVAAPSPAGAGTSK